MEVHWEKMIDLIEGSVFWIRSSSCRRALIFVDLKGIEEGEIDVSKVGCEDTFEESGVDGGTGMAGMTMAGIAAAWAAADGLVMVGIDIGDDWAGVAGEEGAEESWNKEPEGDFWPAKGMSNESK